MLLAYVSLHTVTSISETIIPDRNKFWQKQKHFILYFYTFIKIVSTEIAVSLKIHAFQRFFFFLRSVESIQDQSINNGQLKVKVFESGGNCHTGSRSRAKFVRPAT